MNENTEIVDRLLNSPLLKTDWVLYFLLGVFAISVFIALWKVVFFVLNRTRLSSLRSAVIALVAGGRMDEFESSLEPLKGVEAAVLHHALRFSPNGADVVDQQMDIALASRKKTMEIGLTFLGTVGANAPFVGLYGTVGGIIKAFRDLSLDTAAGSSAVIAGIAEALVATAVGLIVAIPAVVAYNYLSKQVKGVVQSSAAINQQVLMRLRAAEEVPGA